jgi:hypothetical protein
MTIEEQLKTVSTEQQPTTESIEAQQFHANRSDYV